MILELKMALNQVLFVLSVILAILAYFFFDLPDKEYQGAEYVEVYNLETIKAAPLSSFDERKGQYNFGRYRSPVKYLNLHKLTKFQNLVQLKEFVYTAVSDDEWFIGSALLQFYYNAAAIVYVYNVKTNESYISQIEMPFLSSLGSHFPVNSSAVNNCVTWKNNRIFDFSARKCYNHISNSYDVQLSGKFQQQVKYDIQYSISLQGEAMSMIFPIGPNRPSMITKYAGAESSARMVLNDKEYFLSDGLGMMDWTRGLLRRLTYWHWLCLSWTDIDTGASYGLHLSEGTYDDPSNISLESTLWINSNAHHINSTIVFTPLNPTAKPYETDWQIHSTDGKIQLLFHFGNVIKGSFHYGLIDGDLFHMWGVYSGTVRLDDHHVVSLNGIGGTLEDHYALW